MHDLVEDSEVDGGDALGVGRVSLHYLTQNIFHYFVEMVLVESVGERLMTSLDIIG